MTGADATLETIGEDIINNGINEQETSVTDRQYRASFYNLLIHRVRKKAAT